MADNIRHKRGYYSLPLAGRRIFRGAFMSRPNRFLVRCTTVDQGVVRAFLPNPGRLSELFFPGVTLHLMDNSADGGERVTQYTVMAVERDGKPVMLHTHWCNDMAQTLLENRAVPGLEGTRIVRREVKVGRSRFDFLLEDDGGEIYLEVKSCTLFGNEVAMFPDAVTERGRRHLLALAQLTEAGYRCYVLFIVQTDRVRYFMPDYHTDLAFARTMLAVRGQVQFMALPVAWKKNLTFQPAQKLLQIPWDYIAREADDRGAYLVLIQLNRSRRLSIGALGEVLFKPGFYTYVGSAMKGLSARMARHQRKRKKMHWHIDYLRAAADGVEILPLRSSHRLECAIASDLTVLMTPSVPGFGCSDCQCSTHLFFMPENPMDDPPFHAWLQQCRMRLPG